MEKFKTTSIYQSILLFALLLCGVVGMAQQTYTNNDTDPYSGAPVGLTSSNTVNCEGEFTIDYELTVAGIGSAELQWSVDNTNWSAVDASPASHTTTTANLYLQVYVTGLTNGSSVTLTLNSVTEDETLRINEVSSTNITCNGQNNGAIEVLAKCGTPPYFYHWDYVGAYSGELDFSLPADGAGATQASNLYAGSYTITVTDGASNTAPITIVLTEPDVLSFTVTGSSYFCEQAEVLFTVTPSGGNSPYTIVVTSQSDITGSGPFNYEDQPSGDYTITVNDAESCPSPESQVFVVNIDDSPPLCLNLPSDYFMPISDYESLSPSNITILPTFVENRSGSGTSGDTAVYSVNLNNINNALINISVFQSGSDWDNDDFFAIHIDYEMDFTGDYTVLSDKCVWAGLNDITGEGSSQNGNTTPTPIGITLRTLPFEANGYGNMYIYIISYAGSGKSYNIDSGLSITGKSVNASITPESHSGNVSDCNDDYSSTPVTSHTDNVINWECNESGNREFWFNRTWTITDDCNNSTVHTQRIMVGTPPTITAANDTIINECYASSVSITSPEYNDACGLAGDDPLSWELFNESNVPIDETSVASISEVGAINGISLNPPVSNPDTTYVIRWTVTDKAGITAFDDQVVKVQAPINIEIIYPAYDFCSGDEVIFNVTITGGTGVYNAPTFDIAGVWSGNANNSSGTFTTSALGFEAGFVTNFTITVIDVTTTAPNPEIIGSCSSGVFSFSDGNGSGEFDIHDKISTNPIERFD